MSGGRSPTSSSTRPDGRVRVHKLLSTPPSYDRAVVAAVSGLVERRRGSRRRRGGPRHDGGDQRGAGAARGRDGAPDDPRTSATCSSYADCGSRTCTTSSGASRRPSSSARLRFEVSERMAADGHGRDARWTRRRCTCSRARLQELGIESVAVCFLHSYLYPEHEQRVGAILARAAPARDDLALERDPARAARVRAVARPRS